MKKLFIGIIVPFMLFSCNKKEENKSTGPINLYSVSENSKYKDFENSLYEKFKDDNIEGVYVADYSKGIDVVYVTKDESYDESKFNSIATYTKEEFKRSFEDMPNAVIGVSLDSQKDKNSNTKNLYYIK